VSSDDQQSLDADKERCYVVMSPNDLVLVKSRDRREHVLWLVERRRYEEALDEMESFEAEGSENSKEENELMFRTLGGNIFTTLFMKVGFPFFLTELIMGFMADDHSFR
jgi:hypothetical protein